MAETDTTARTGRHRYVFWATVVTVAVIDLALLKAGLVTGPVAVALLLLTEATVTLVSLTLASASARRKAHREGHVLPWRDAALSVLPKPVATFAAVEARMFATGWRLIRRAPPSPGTETFTGRRGVSVILAAAIAVTAVEAAAVHYLVPWPAVQIAALCVNAYGLLWLGSMWAGLVVYPHRVTTDTITVSFSFLKKATVPLAAVASVTVDTHMASETWFAADTSGTFHAPVGGQTNVLLTLTGQQEHLGGASRVRLWADDPAGFVGAVTRQRESAAHSHVEH